MRDPLKKILQPIRELQNIRGVALPIGLEFLQLVVTGPPGAGKSYYIEQIRGWPNEGFLDLTRKGWWKNQSLVFRPREVHLGLPFRGFKEPLTVFDREWLGCTVFPDLELSRIILPPEKKYFFQADYRNRYIFEFLIPSPSLIYERRIARQSKGYFPVDDNLTMEMVRQQVAVYREMALYLHRAGLNVYIRKDLNKPPMHISEPGQATVPRWTLVKKPSAPSLKTWAGWKWLISRKSPTHWLELEDDPLELERTGRIAHDGKGFELQLGSTKLLFRPEIRFGVKRNSVRKHWLITAQQGCPTRTMHGFARIKVGETIVLGRESHEYSELFTYADDVAKRHISVTNRKGDLILSPLSQDAKTVLRRTDDHDYREQLERTRYKVLLELRNLYGGKIQPLPKGEALATLRKLNELLRKEPRRPLNKNDEPGGLIQLADKTIPVLVGDLHAQVDNLLKIISENCLLDCLRQKTATLIILGDSIHSENMDELESFDSSMTMLDLIFKLKLRFPQNVFYIRGNHDSFAPDINKNGVLQGELFRDWLEEVRGGEYVAEMEHYFAALPYFVCSNSFIACHAGPPRVPCSVDDLININDNPQLAKSLISSRLQRPNYPAGYTKRDVKKLRKGLGVRGSSRFIVGHTPMDPFNSFWLHAGAIKNHHIIYSAHNEGPGLLIRISDTSFMPIVFPSEPLTDVINNIH